VSPYAKYRSEIGNYVREVVQGGMTVAKASDWIRQQAEEEMSYDDCDQFIKTVEMELRSLHEGNIARYRLRPGEFAQWKAGKS